MDHRMEAARKDAGRSLSSVFLFCFAHVTQARLLE
jgi:hypothetical protein